MGPSAEGEDNTRGEVLETLLLFFVLSGGGLGVEKQGLGGSARVYEKKTGLAI